MSWMYFLISSCCSRPWRVSENRSLLLRPLTYSVSWKSLPLAMASSYSFFFCWNLRSSSSSFLRSSSSFSNFLYLSSSFLFLRSLGLSTHLSVLFWLYWYWWMARFSSPSVIYTKLYGWELCSPAFSSWSDRPELSLWHPSKTCKSYIFNFIIPYPRKHDLPRPQLTTSSSFS